MVDISKFNSMLPASKRQGVRSIRTEGEDLTHAQQAALYYARKKRRARIAAAVVVGSIYSIAGVEPKIVIDYTSILGTFGSGYFTKDEVEVAHDSVVTHAATGLATCFDSDGLLKWRAHNFFLNSAVGVTQNITTEAVQYTLGFKGTGSVTLTGTSTDGPLSGTGAEDLVTLNLTPTAGTLTLTVAGSITDVRFYRSDLGGMQVNPDATTDTTYVVTTGTAVYKRRINYVYDGADWNVAGCSIEPLSAKNDIVNSNNIQGSNWLNFASNSLTFTANQGTGPDGNMTMDKVAVTDNNSEEHILYSDSHLINNGQDYCASAVVEYVSQQFVAFRLFSNSQKWTTVIFDIDSGLVTQENEGTDPGALPVVVGSGVVDLSGGLLRIWTTINIKENILQVAVMTVSSGTPSLNAFGAEPAPGVGGSYFYLGHIQFEKGSVPSSILPTAGATRTRPVETLKIAAADLASVVNTDAMSIWIKGDLDYADVANAETSQPVFWQVDANNFLTHDLDTVGALTGSIVVSQKETTSGLDITTGTTELTPGTNKAYNVASRHLTAVVNMASAGSAETENATPTVLADLSTADLELAKVGNMNIAQVSLFDADIADTGLETISG